MKKSFAMNEILVKLQQLHIVAGFETARTLKTKANYGMAKNKETFEGLRKAFYAPVLLTEDEDKSARDDLGLDSKAQLTFDMLKDGLSKLKSESVIGKVNLYHSELKVTHDVEIHTVDEETFAEMPTEIAMILSWMI